MWWVCVCGVGVGVMLFVFMFGLLFYGVVYVGGVVQLMVGIFSYSVMFLVQLYRLKVLLWCLVKFFQFWVVFDLVVSFVQNVLGSQLGKWQQFGLGLVCLMLVFIVFFSWFMLSSSCGILFFDFDLWFWCLLLFGKVFWNSLFLWCVLFLISLILVCSFWVLSDCQNFSVCIEVFDLLFQLIFIVCIGMLWLVVLFSGQCWQMIFLIKCFQFFRYFGGFSGRKLFELFFCLEVCRVKELIIQCFSCLDFLMLKFSISMMNWLVWMLILLSRKCMFVGIVLVGQILVCFCILFGLLVECVVIGMQLIVLLMLCVVFSGCFLLVVVNVCSVWKQCLISDFQDWQVVVILFSQQLVMCVFGFLLVIVLLVCMIWFFVVYMLLWFILFFYWCCRFILQCGQCSSEQCCVIFCMLFSMICLSNFFIGGNVKLLQFGVV